MRFIIPKTLRQIAILILALTSISATLPAKKIPVGYNFNTKDSVYAEIVTFPLEISNVYQASNKTNLFITIDSAKTFSASRYFIHYDIPTRKLVQYCELNRNARQVFFRDSNIVLNTPLGGQCNDFDGKIRKTYTKNISYVSAKYSIGIIAKGYGSTTLDAINLQTGERVWKMPLHQNLTWESIKTINDEILIIESEGVYGLRLSDGRNWYYKAVDYDLDPPLKEPTLLTAASVLVGLAAGFIVVPTANPIRGISSNTLIDNDTIYYAHKDTVVCLGRFGQKYWQSALPRNTMSRSSIIADSNKLIVVNYGYAFENGNKVLYGKPFISGFDKHSGERLYYSQVSVAGEYIVDVDVSDTILTLLLPTTTVRYGLNSGQMLSENKTNSAEKGIFYIANSGDLYFQNTDSTFIKKDNSTLIETSKGLHLTLNPDGTYSDVDTVASYFSRIGEKDEFIILSNDSKTVLIDKSGKLISVASLPRQSAVINDLVVCVMNKQIYVVDFE